MKDEHLGVSETNTADANQATPQHTTNPVITVVRDPHQSLGKKFTLTPEGKISKQSAVSLSFGIAATHQVNTCNELADLLKSVGDDPHAAIINASFNDIPVGEEFLILSKKEFEKRTGIPRDDRDRQKGIHTISHNGKNYKAVGLFRENVLPSCWQYFDRDIDEHTPEKFTQQIFPEWFSTLAQIVPGLVDTSWCRVGSTSARVLHEGIPIGRGNGHLRFKIKNPWDIERFRTAILIAAAKADMTWLKPRYSRKESDTVVGHSLTTIIDPSVFTPGRLTFISRPVENGGLTVELLSIFVHKGGGEIRSIPPW